MQTIFDWISMALFVGLITLFLQRSVGTSEPQDHLWHYASPALGCALFDQLGNSGGTMAAIAAFIGLGAVAAYSYFILIVRRV